MSAKVEEFDFHAIGSLAISKKLGGESIDIATTSRPPAAPPRCQVAHGRAETFIAAFRRVHSGARTASPGLAPQAASALDLADQIRKLSELRDAGILTDEEFNSKKADLLSRI